MTARNTAYLAAALALVVLARLLLELRGDAWFWGLDYARYLAPGWRSGPWVIALAATVLAAIPPVRRIFVRFFGPIAEWPAGTYALTALAAAALCFTFPDLTLFTGDFTLRRSAVAGVTDFDRLFPQAMPLDRLAHWVVPRALRSWTGLPVDTIASVIGAIEAGVFGSLAVAFARRCGVRGVAAVVAAAVVLGSAALGLFTGYDKSFAEMGIITLAFAVVGLGEISRGRAGWTSGLLVAAAIAFHRSGLALVPAWLALWVLVPGSATARGPREWPWPRLVPAAAIVAVVPLAWRVFRAVDARHLAPGGASHALAAAVESGRLLSLANLGLLLMPLVPLLPVAVVLARPDRDRSLRWLGWLAISWLLPMLLIHPVQGEFRDWDDFTPGAVAISLPLAVLLARASAAAPAPLAIAIVAAALVPRVQWLALQASPSRSLTRIEEWSVGPPAPPRTIAASTLEYVSMVHYRDGRVSEGRRAMETAIARAPMERLYLEWANAEADRGEWSLALDLYRQAASHYPADPTPWWMLTQAALRHGDREAAERGVAGLRRLVPGDPGLARIEAVVRAMPASPPR
jgi:hypothetical protein